MEAYGEQRRTKSMSKVRVRRRCGRATDNECDFPLNVVFLADCTLTMEDEWDGLVNTELRKAMEGILVSHPLSKFSSILFQDKPVEPFGLVPSEANGYYSDFCVRTDGLLRTSTDDTLDLLKQHTPTGGGDVFEAQFVALMAASQLPLEWADDSVKLIVLITDAPPHFDADGLNHGSLTPHADDYDLEDPEGQCRTQYYPSPSQVKDSIEAIGAYVSVVAFEHHEMNSLVTRSWLWFLRYLGHTDAFLSVMEGSNTDTVAEKILSTIAEIEKIECDSKLTTSPQPTSAATTAKVSVPFETTRSLDCPPCPNLWTSQTFPESI